MTITVRETEDRAGSFVGHDRRACPPGTEQVRADHPPFPCGWRRRKHKHATCHDSQSLAAHPPIDLAVRPSAFRKLATRDRAVLSGGDQGRKFESRPEFRLSTARLPNTFSDIRNTLHTMSVHEMH